LALTASRSLHLGGPPEIEVKEVSFTYRGSTEPALHGISFVQRRGEIVGVVGPSGAGKSTLVKCLNRLVPSFDNGTFAGVVKIAGQTLAEQRVCDVAPLVGMVFQDFESQLFSTNVAHEVAFAMEQCGYSREEMVQRVGAALRAVGLEGFESRDPATLSGGEKQRLAVAAVMALRPRVIVLDEPTTDLDPQGRAEVFALIEQMRLQGATLVLVEHDLEALRVCDRLLVVRDGRIVADLPPSELMARVELLESCRLRPPDLSLLCERLGITPHTQTLEEAERAIRARFRICATACESRLDYDASASSCLPVTRVGQEANKGRQEALIEVRKLTYAYPEGRLALEDIDFAVGSGEFVAIVGRNGSGKSTLAKHLVGILRPTRGQVLLGGRDLSRLTVAEISRHVGFVFQNPDHQIFAATVEEEVAFGPRNFGLKPDEVAERTQRVLAAVGLEKLRFQDPFLLSKGERQRVAVAAALALNPRVLILDEPTTGLDFFEQRRMMELLTELNRGGVAIVIITHTPWLVACYARRVVMMERGRKVFDGPVRQFFASSELLENSAFRLPEVTALSRRLGLVALTVDELVSVLEARS